MKTKLLRKLRAESKKVVTLKDIVFVRNIILFYITKITKTGSEEVVYKISGEPTVIADVDYIKTKFIYPQLQEERKRYILERVYELKCKKARKLL